MLSDKSPIPYGQYAAGGKKCNEDGSALTMEEVPASYLFWLLDNGRASVVIDAYIRENYDVLVKEIEEERVKNNDW